MTSPRRTKKCSGQHIPILDWDSPSDETGTVKRRRSSCPDNASSISLSTTSSCIFETHTSSDSGSCISKSIDDTEKSDSLFDVEERISTLINENRSSQSNSESGDLDLVIEDILQNSSDEFISTPLKPEIFIQNDVSAQERSKTFIKQSVEKTDIKSVTKVRENTSDKNKSKERRLKAPTPIRKLNKSLDIIKQVPQLGKDTKKVESKSVLPIYKSTVNTSEIDLSLQERKKVTSKLRLPFTPTKTMDKPKINIFQNKNNSQENKPSSLLSIPVRRTISNEYVRLKFGNDTVMRRTIDGKSVPKITPKIQSIIPESPVDAEDPFLNLSPNKKYTVTVNNEVRCDKDNYVIFDPNTGFKPDQILGQSKIPSKVPSNSDKSKIPKLKSPTGEKSSAVSRQSVNVSDSDSGILSPNSPVDSACADEACAYANAAAFSVSAKKCAANLDITILDPKLAKKAVEQIKVSAYII